MARVKKRRWVDDDALAKVPSRKLRSFRKGVELCWAWMKAHGVELPGLVVTDDRGWVGKDNYASYHNYRRREVAINVGKCSFTKRVHGVHNHSGGVEDFTPEGVLCHEVGHHVDRVLGTRKRGKGKSKGWLSYSKEWMDLVNDEEPVSRFEHNVLESFAEAFRLFVTNPDLLRVGRFERYEFFVDVLGWRPIKPMTPWRVVLRGSTPAHKRYVERWIARGQE